MTEDEILKIKEHIEIHARREPRAIKITEIMWKAVGELEHIAELEAYNEKLLNSDIEKHNKIVSLGMENAELKETVAKMNYVITETFSNLTQAKELLKKIEKIVYNGENEIKRLSKIVDILAEAEQFLKEE